MTGAPDRKGLLRIGLALAATALAMASLLILDFDWAVPLFLLVVISVTMLVLIGVRADKDLPWLCDPLVLYCAYASQLFIVGPLGLILLGPMSYRGITQADVVITLAAFELHLVMFAVAYQSRFGEVIAHALPDFAGASRRRLPLRLGLGILGGLCALGWIGFAEYQGGFLTLLLGAYGTSKPAHLFALPILGTISVTYLFAWWILARGPVTRRTAILFGAVVLGEVFLYGIVLGARKRVFFLFFGLVAIYLLVRGARKVPWVRIASGILVLVLFSAYWATVRGRPIMEVLSGQSDPRAIPQRSLEEGFFSTVSGPFEVACLVTAVFPDREPFRYGGTMVVTLLGFIPRSVWPDKPVGIGKELTRYVTVNQRYDPTGGFSITPTLVGGFYADLGLLGVAIGGLLMGLVSRTMLVYSKLDMVNGIQLNCARVVLPAIFLSGLIEVRAAMSTMMAHYILSAFPVLLMLVFFRTTPDRSPEPVAAPGSSGARPAARGTLPLGTASDL